MKKNLITRIGRLMAMPLAVAALVACNEENIVDNTQLDAVGISVAMTGTAETVTRATTTLPSGDLKLCYGSIDGSLSAIYTGSGSSWSSTTPLYWQRLSSVSGKYPFYAVSPADGSLTGVPADQRTASVAADADLLLAFAEPSYKSTIALNFKHALSMVEVNLTNGGGMEDSELNTATLTIDGLQTAYTVSGTTATASGTAATGLQPLQSGSNFRFIAPAQELVASGLTLNFTVTINGAPVAYTYKNTADLTLVAGKKTVFNISVSKTALDVNITVADWETNTTNTTLRIEGVTTGDGTLTVSGNAIAPAQDDALFLTYVDNSALSTAAGQSATYTYNGTAWAGTPELIWENIAATDATPYSFAALYTPAAGTAPQKDYLVGLATTNTYGNNLSLSLTHALAKMAITLVAAEDSPEDLLTGISTRTVTLTDYSAVAVTANGTADITLADAAADMAFTDGTEFFVAPQTLTDVNTIVLTRANGNTYTIKLTGLQDVGAASASASPLFTDNKIEAGKHYAITLTVSETAVSITASIEPWTEVNGSGTVTPDF